MLQKKFGKIFPQQIKPEPLVLGGQWKDAGHLVLDQFQADDGWLSIAYRWVPKAAGAKPVAGGIEEARGDRPAARGDRQYWPADANRLAG